MQLMLLKVRACSIPLAAKPALLRGMWSGSNIRQHGCVGDYVIAMVDPAKEPGNWTEHTHSDGRRYYYNKEPTEVYASVCLRS